MYWSRRLLRLPISGEVQRYKTLHFIAVDNKAIAKGAEYELKRISEAPEQKPLVPPKNVKATTTLYVKAPASADEFEKQLKSLLPYKFALEPLPEKDRAIKMPESSKPDNVNRRKYSVSSMK